LIIGNLVSSQAHAEDVTTQPLTRSDCDKAGMSWDDNANVCGQAHAAAKSMPKPQAAKSLSQPLTRSDCDKAGMVWNDNANVCGKKSEAQVAPKATNPAAPTIVINIDKTKQRMTVSLDGVQRYDWPVSTGKAGYSTPSGTFTPLSMNKVWYSKEWDNAPMPHAIFFMKDGHAIHGSYEVSHLGKAVSHGCVRISPQNATTLYTLVDKTGLKNTQVVLAGDTPGGEAKVANSERSRTRHHSQNAAASRTRHVAATSRTRHIHVASRSFTPRHYYYADSSEPPQRRGGFLRRLFGGR
jgi:lipoprotein-anchoring transpeptidase ErfK/SrfK